MFLDNLKKEALDLKAIEAQLSPTERAQLKSMSPEMKKQFLKAKEAEAVRKAENSLSPEQTQAAMMMDPETKKDFLKEVAKANAAAS